MNIELESVAVQELSDEALEQIAGAVSADACTQGWLGGFSCWNTTNRC